MKNIEYYKFNRINKKKAHIVLIFIFIVLYILFSLNMIIYGAEEKDIVGDTKVGLEVGEQKELVYTIDRKYILQIDKVKKNNSNISVMKTYTSESSPNKVFIEIKGISKGTTEMSIYYNYTTISQIVDKYSSTVKKVIIEVGKNGNSTNNSSESINNNNIEGKVSDTNIDRNINAKKNNGENGNTENLTSNEVQEENIIITSKDINEIFDGLNNDNKSKEEKNNQESDKEREQKKEEDEKILKDTKKDENIFRNIILLGTIIALLVHIYKYIKFER
ncbi:MAG: hypothetical protein HG454_003105 [Clostridiales bacterium]|nr:hypothetical protein [Clostridiales bacterium]